MQAEMDNFQSRDPEEVFEIVSSLGIHPYYYVSSNTEFSQDKVTLVKSSKL